MEANCFFSKASSVSSRATSSFNSITLRSFAAIAIIKSFTLESGDAADLSWGVAGTEDGAGAEVEEDADGVGLEGSFVGGAIGKEKESLLGIREAELECA